MKRIDILLITEKPDVAHKVKSYLERKSNFRVLSVQLSMRQTIGTFLTSRFDVDVILIDDALEQKPNEIRFIQEILESGQTSPPIIFVANLDHYDTLEPSVHIRSHNYYFKSLNNTNLIDGLDLALNKFHNDKNQIASLEKQTLYIDKSFLIKKNNTLIKVLEKDINYITVEGRYSKIHTSSTYYLVQLSLKNFLKIASSIFLRVHRNYIVNYNQIQKVFLHDNLILLKNGDHITISRKYKQEFLLLQEILV